MLSKNTTEIILLFIVLFISLIHSHPRQGHLDTDELECRHDLYQKQAEEEWQRVEQEEKLMVEKYLNGEQVDEEHLGIKKFKARNQNKKRRNLATSYTTPTDGNTQPIRIKMNTEAIQGYSTSVASPQQKDFILKQIEVAKAFYEKRLKVVPLQDPNLVVSVSQCVQHDVPALDKSAGVGADVDFYVYVTAENAPDQGFLAWAAYCQRETFDSGDDTSYGGRPTVARLHYNTAYLTGFEHTDFAQTLETTLHEMAHALVFSSSIFPLFRKPDGFAYKTEVRIEDVMVRGLPTDILVTPEVRKWAANHFGCDRINDDTETDNIFKGMQLENQGSAGSAGSHWERTMVYDEVMTASRLGPSKTFSGLTWAIFKDSNFYIVDDSNAENLQWGYKKGCDFYEKACQSTTQQYDEFCQLENETKCSGGREGKGGCVKQNLSAYFMDECGLVNPYGNGRCIESADGDFDSNRVYSKQTYNYHDSRCFDSSLGGGGNSKCYKYECTSTPTIKVYLDGLPTDGSDPTHPMECTFEGEEFFNVFGLQGTFVCPDPFRFCEQGRKFCDNWCNSKGYCADGVCNCAYGYGGSDCSIDTCDGGLDIDTDFYDPTANANAGGCIAAASCCDTGSNPNGCAKYSNKFNRECLNCSNLCATCLQGGIDKCTSCDGGKFLYINGSGIEGVCVATCPDGYWGNGGTCDPCASGCATCENGTDCLSCPENEWLDLHKSSPHTCVANQSQCASGKKIDEEYKHCVTSCSSEKVEDTGFCIRCVDPQFKDQQAGACVNSCKDGNGDSLTFEGAKTYEDTVNRVCAKCDTTVCDECQGPKTNECVTCQPSKYFFQSRCLDDAAQCPFGSYGDNINFKCKTCNEACFICTGPDANECSQCKSGYYFEDPSNCVTNCTLTNQYPDGTTRKCEDCHISCATCSKETEFDCLTCPVSKFLKKVGVQQTCVDACDAGQYSDTNSVCQKCYHTCSSCNGLTLDNCVTCIDGYYKHEFDEIDGTGATITKNQCLYKCPVGFYGVNEGTEAAPILKCLICHSNCQKCSGPLETECMACYNDSSLPYLDTGVCVASCPADKPLDEFTFECQSNKLIFSIILLTLFALII